VPVQNDGRDVGSEVQGGPLIFELPRLETGLFDLCIFEEAIAAGLDGGEIDIDRRRIGTDCDESRGMRYAYRGDDGSVALGDSPQAARQASADLQSGGQACADVRGTLDGTREELADCPDEMLGPLFSTRGTLLGHYASSRRLVELQLRPQAGRSEEIVVLHDSLTLHDGWVRGLVQNLSQEHWAADLRVALDDGVWEYPLTLQPGEIAPFELAWPGDALPGDEDFAIGQTFFVDPDLRRSIRAGGAPGYFKGPAESYGRLFTVDEPDLRRGVAVFETAIMMELPSEPAGLEERLRGGRIENLVALVAFFDEDRRVIDVAEAHVGQVRRTANSADDRMLDFGDSRSIGFVVPHDVVGFSIWFGGT
jgi:hypothetical protein